MYASNDDVEVSAKLPWIIFAGALLVWIVILAIAAPAFGQFDTFIFRDPGCALAAGDGFVSRSIPNDGTSIAPHLYGLYTPGAPLLFALPAKLFGCTSYTDAFYNLFFFALAGALTLTALFRVVKALRIRLALTALVSLLLPCGLFFTDGDRPEEPAFCLLAGLLLLWKYAHSVAARALLTGLSGLVFLIHPLAGIMGLMLFGYLLLFDEKVGSLQLRALIAVSGGIIFCGLVTACALYMLHLDSTVVHRFLGHAFGANTGVGVVLKGDPGSSAHRSLLSGFAYAFSRVFWPQANYLSGVLNISAMLVSALLFGYTLMRFAKGSEKTKVWIQYFGLTAITLLFPLLLFFAQQYYFPLTNGLLLVMLCLGGYTLSDRARKSTAPLAIVAVSAFFTLPPLMVHVLEPVETRDSYKRAVVQAERVARIFGEQHISNAPILTDFYQFYVYKPRLKNLYDVRYLLPTQSTDAYKGLLLCDTSQFPNEKPFPEPLKANDWKLVDASNETVRITLLGKPIMRRNWAWSCDAYVRK